MYCICVCRINVIGLLELMSGTSCCLTVLPAPLCARLSTSSDDGPCQRPVQCMSSMLSPWRRRLKVGAGGRTVTFHPFVNTIIYYCVSRFFYYSQDSLNFYYVSVCVLYLLIKFLNYVCSAICVKLFIYFEQTIMYLNLLVCKLVYWSNVFCFLRIEAICC